jgi:hypothetical protein
MFVSKKITQPILDDINRFVVSVVHDHPDMVPHHIMTIYQKDKWGPHMSAHGVKYDKKIAILTENTVRTHSGHQYTRAVNLDNALQQTTHCINSRITTQFAQKHRTYNSLIQFTDFVNVNSTLDRFVYTTWRKTDTSGSIESMSGVFV